MKTVFADTQFWVAIINPRDQWHERALEAEASLIEPFYITSEAVLSEVLTFFCEYGAEARLKAAATVELILNELNTEVVTVTHERPSFHAGKSHRLNVKNLPEKIIKLAETILAKGGRAMLGGGVRNQ